MKDMDDLTRNLMAHRDPAFDRVLYQKDEYTRLVLSRSTFMTQQYLSVRYWYLDFDEQWCPTGDGVNWHYNEASYNLLVDALTELVKNSN